MTLRIGSLCTGTGALDMAVMDVFGGSMAWHCQYEPPDKNGREDKHQYAARILAHHWPDVPNLGDVTKVDWSQVELVDAVTAGFPCTDVSVAGLRAGIAEGTRSGLWNFVRNAVAAQVAMRAPGEPGPIVILENVGGLLSARADSDVEPCPWCLGDPADEPHLRALGAVLGDLAGLGFDAEWVSVKASDVGAPHARNRVFILAWPAADAPDLGHERGRSSRHGRPGLANGHLAVAHTPGIGRREGGAEHAGIVWGSDAPLGGAAALADPAGVGDQDEPRHHAAAELIAQLGTGDRADLRHPAQGADQPGRGAPVVAWGVYEPAIRRWEHILGRPAPSPIDDGGRLAPAFVEWMMGLPEGHVCDVPAPGMTPAGLRNARLKALGNGVVPAQAAYALRLLSARAGVSGVAA